MDDFDRYLNEQMKDPDFKKEWVENEARYQLMMMVLRARNEEHLTHLSWRSAQGFGSRISAAIEKGQTMPSMAALAKTAHGLGKRLEIRFISSYQQSTSIKPPFCL